MASTLDATEEIYDVQAGYILWLPSKDKIGSRFLIGVELDNDGFNHPVVILSVNILDRKATIFLVSVPNWRA
jgi:hypothetical protein